MGPLQFERVAQIVAVASFDRNDAVLQHLCVSNEQFELSFSEYVKSQIHLNVVGDLYGRRLQEYVQANHYIRGEKSYLEQAKAVLRYFYRDVAQFLINNPKNVRMGIITDGMHLPKLDVDVYNEREKFRPVLAEAESNPELLRNFEYAFIIDKVLNRDDALTKLDNYALAAILFKHADEADLKQINVRW